MCRKQSVIAHDGSACEPIKDAGDSSSDDDTDTVLIIDRKAIEIAWQKMRNNLINEQSVIVQAKCLCGQYMRARLKRAGILNRKVSQRLRTFLDGPTSCEIREVFPALNTMCEELERMHPRVYANVGRQLSRAPFGELEEAHTAPFLLNAVAKDLFKNGINWAKIVSIFAVSGGLAVDIVRQGHYDYLPRLIEGTGEIVDDDLVPWLVDNGGWSGLLDHIRIRPTYYFHKQFTAHEWITIATSIFVSIYFIVFIVRSIGTNSYSLL